MTNFQLRAPRASRNARARPLPRMLKLTVPALAVGALAASAAAAETAPAAGATANDAAML